MNSGETGSGPAFAILGFRSAALRELVRAPWTLSYAGSVRALEGVIVPDAHVEFVFQLGAPCATRCNNVVRPSPVAMIYAQRRGAIVLLPTGANAILAFRAAPAVASAILGRSLDDCWDRPVDLVDLIGPDAGRLVDALADRPMLSWSGFIESWLISRLSGWSADNRQQLRLQHHLLWASTDGSVAALADRLGLTARTLQRHVNRHAGLSPKQLSISGRILRGCAQLVDRPGRAIAEIALDLGFNDQSAFTNSFRHQVGLTPAELRAEPLVHVERAGASG